MDLVFANLTSASSLDALCSAAPVAASGAARYDMRPAHGGAALASDEATIAYLRAPEAREMLETWLGAYSHDEATLTALADDARAEVLASAWRGYEATVLQMRDAARAAA